MNIIAIGAMATGVSLPATTLFAEGAAVRVRQWAYSAEATYASAGRRLRRAVSERKEAFEYRLQEFVLELLAAIVLIAIFMIVTDPAAREDAGVQSQPSPR
jgi:hypothetical protein